MPRIVSDITQINWQYTGRLGLNRLPDVGSAEVCVKLERFNPSGSVKDRAAFALIAKQRRAGLSVRVIQSSSLRAVIPASGLR